MHKQKLLVLALVPLIAFAWWLIESSPHYATRFFGFTGRLDHSKQNAFFEEWNNVGFAPEDGFEVNLETGTIQNLDKLELTKASSNRQDDWLFCNPYRWSHLPVDPARELN